MNTKTRLLLLICPFLFCSCISKENTHKIEEEFILKTYGIRTTNISFYELAFSTFIKKKDDTSFNYPILISRPDCSYCVDSINNLNQRAKDDNIIIRLYLLDSNTLKSEEKEQLLNDYMISSVPTYITMDNRSISNINTGYLTDDLYNSLKKEGQ